MTASTQAGQAARAAPLPCPAPAASEGVMDMREPLRLALGGVLPRVSVAWRCAGPEDAPAVAVLGGISATRRVADGDDGPGWWPGLVGPGRGLDTDRYRVLSFDWLGGSGGTTGPAAGERFPSVAPADQAEILARLLDELGLPRLHAFVGASYGGMVALAFAAAFPGRVGRLLVVSAAHRAHALATAWRSLQRRIVRLGLAHGAAAEALALSRGLAMTTYRSPEEFDARFAGDPGGSDGERRFPVDDYLDARGADFVARMRPEPYLCLSESIDLMDVDPRRIATPATLVGVRQDQLVPLAQMRSLARRLAGPVRLVELDSLYGHDAFLKEDAALAPVFADALAGGDA